MGEIEAKFYSNRLQERPIIPFPRGMDLRCSSTNSMSDSLYGKGYQEMDITNETFRGVQERAEFTKTKYGEVSTFTGVGHPVKTLVQASILQPTDYLGFVDISGQNVHDAVLLATALRSGYATLKSYLETKEGAELLSTIQKVIPDKLEYILQVDSDTPYPMQREIISKGSDHLQRLDKELSEILEDMHLTTNDTIKAVQSVSHIGIRLSDIRYEDALLEPTQTDGVSIIDSSNIPLFSSAPLEAKGEHAVIFYSINAINDTQRRLQVPDYGYGKSDNGKHSFWNYPLNDPRTRATRGKGVLPVGMSSYKDYQTISRRIDEIDRKW